MGLFERFPYTNFHELNAGWMLEVMKKLEEAWEQFTAGNSLSFADPLTYDATKSYAKNTIVLDENGNAYISLQAVPKGVAPGNQDYWLMVFDYEAFMEKVNKNFTGRYYRDENRAKTPMAVGDWLTFEDVLCKATAAIAVDDLLEVGTNIEHFTLEDFIKNFMTSANQMIQQYKNDIDASELAFTNHLQEQFDQVIAGVTVDSEVILAREAYNGKTYPTLGDAKNIFDSYILAAFKGNYFDIAAYFGRPENTSLAGVDMTNNGDDTFSFSGTASGTFYANLFVDALHLPVGLEVGKKYKLKFNATNVNIDCFTYVGGSPTLLFREHQDYEFTVPSCEGIHFRFNVSNGITVNETVSWPQIISCYDNEVMSPIANGVEVPNNTDLNNITTTGRYLLLGLTYTNCPISSNTGFLFVSSIGNTVYQIAYDFNMRFSYRRRAINNVFGAWVNEAYPNNVSIAAGTDLNTLTLSGNYLIFSGVSYPNIPDGFNGGVLIVQTIDNVTLQFMIELATRRYAYRRAISGTFNSWFYSDGSDKRLNIAMFGDSIIWGRDGAGSGQVGEPIPVLIERNSRRYKVTNKGVGGMGWYQINSPLTQNAYDYIQTQDLTDYDVIVLSYGLNDPNVALGTYLDTTPNSIMGCIFSCINYVHTNYPDKTVILIGIPNSCLHTEINFPEWDWFRTRTGGWSDEDFDTECVKFCNYYHVPYISNKQSVFNSWNMPDFLPDGVHPNQKGYNLIGLRYKGEIDKILGF